MAKVTLEGYVVISAINITIKVGDKVAILGDGGNARIVAVVHEVGEDAPFPKKAKVGPTEGQIIECIRQHQPISGIKLARELQVSEQAKPILHTMLRNLRKRNIIELNPSQGLLKGGFYRLVG